MALFSPQLVMGLTIMGLGMTLVLDRLGIVHARDILAFWPILIVLFGASIAAQALVPVSADEATPRRYRRSGIPCFFLLIMIVAMFASFGVSSRVQARGGADDVNVVAILSGARSGVATDFHGGHLTGVMGRAVLDLRQAKLAPGQEAVVDVFVTMGGSEILVPDDWVVDTSALPVMGNVRDERWSRTRDATTTPDGTPAPRLVVRGFVMMGKLGIGS